MGTLLTSVDFWVGAVVLLAYQFSKFSELSAADPSQAARARIIPNLRAIDFAGRTSFFSALIFYLAATFAVFLLVCSISPAIIRGWAVVSGNAGSYDKMVAAVPFPIYIAALYMGLTQPAIPIFSTITNVQRDIFHYWIGVPMRVLETSDFFTNQIFAREGGTNGFKETIEELTSDKWIRKIDPYADAFFYRDQLKRLKLDDPSDLAQVLGGSDRELKRTIDQLVYAAALATVRESGGRALKRLSDDLKVAIPGTWAPLRGVAAGAILAAVTLVFLWFALPLARGLTGTPPSPYWPETLTASGQYLMSQSVSLLIAVALILYTRHPADPALLPSSWFDGLSDTFERNVGPLLWTFMAVLVFDYIQSLLDFSSASVSSLTGFAFLAGWAPYHILHATISMSACLLLLVFMDTRHGARGGRLLPAASMVAVIAVAAAFYAMVRLTFQFNEPVGKNLSYVFLVVFLNVVAGLLGLLTGLASARRPRAVPDEAAEGRRDAAVGPTVVPLPNLQSRN